MSGSCPVVRPFVLILSGALAHLSGSCPVIERFCPDRTEISENEHDLEGSIRPNCGWQRSILAQNQGRDWRFLEDLSMVGASIRTRLTIFFSIALGILMYELSYRLSSTS